MRIAVTGHMDISTDSAPLIREQIDLALARIGENGDIVGVSCIARGADSIFAEAVLERGGSLEVVLPATNYRVAKVKEADRPRFDRLVSSAALVNVMPFAEANRAAYEAANSALLHDADLLIAVWDGNVSKPGGTGTVVAEARAARVPVDVIWPRGARRT
jgi:hypothetical protein